MRNLPFALSSRLLMLALAATVCLSSVVLAASLPPALQSRYVGLIGAAKTCDIKTFSTFIGPGFVSVDPTGKTSTRAQYLAGIQGLMKGAKTMVVHIKYTDVKTHRGIVNVSFDINGQLAKPDGITTFHEVGTDSWGKHGKTWVQVKSMNQVFIVTAPKPLVRRVSA